MELAKDIEEDLSNDVSMASDYDADNETEYETLSGASDSEDDGGRIAGLELLDLPIDILRKIWSELLCTTRLVEDPASRTGSSVARLGLQPQILRLNRAIFGQSFEFLYQLNSFVFTTPADLQNFYIPKMTCTQCDKLHMIERRGFKSIKNIQLRIHNNISVRHERVNDIDVATFLLQEIEIPRNMYVFTEAQMYIQTWTDFFQRIRFGSIMPSSLKHLEIKLNRNTPYSITKHMGYTEPTYFVALVVELANFLKSSTTGTRISIRDMGNMKLEQYALSTVRKSRRTNIVLRLANCDIAKLELKHAVGDDAQAIELKYASMVGEVTRAIEVEIESVKNTLRMLTENTTSLHRNYHAYVSLLAERRLAISIALEAEKVFNKKMAAFDLMREKITKDLGEWQDMMAHVEDENYVAWLMPKMGG